MGFQSSSSSSSSQSETTQWATNAQPSAYGTNQFVNMLGSYMDEANQAYAPYEAIGRQGANQYAALLGLDGYDPLQAQGDALSSLIGRSGNMPMPGHVRYGADSANGDVDYAGAGEQNIGGSGSGKGGVGNILSNISGKPSFNTNIRSGEYSDGLNIPDPVTRTDFNVDALDGRRRAQNEMERRTYVSNQIADQLRNVELGLADLTMMKDPTERQQAFDALNEQLTGTYDSVKGTNVDDPYWQQFMGDYAHEIAMFQKDLQRDFKAELPGQKSVQETLEATPGYQFRYDQGMKAANASIAGRGLRGSGQQLKELTEYGQDFASSEYDNALNRYLGAAGFGGQATSQNQALQANLGQISASGYLAGSGTIIRGPISMYSQSSSQSSSSGMGVSL